ncbi:SDR family NAD(P)-dependent oxidoreductase [Bradyrhizobium diazoefficiens]
MIGGAGDIGAAISNQFCDLGATVTATGANEADLARTLLKPRAGLALATLDVTDDAAVTSFAGKYQRVDALINCGGILARDKEFEIETFMKVLDVNLTGTFRTCMAFQPRLAETKGSIVNIASMNATLALPRIPAYCASKGGVVMLTKALALKWAEQGIRVNSVARRLCRDRDQRRRPRRSRTLSAHCRPHRVQALGTAGRHRGRRRLPMHASLAICDRHRCRRGWRVSCGMRG